MNQLIESKFFQMYSERDALVRQETRLIVVGSTNIRDVGSRALDLLTLRSAVRWKDAKVTEPSQSNAIKKQARF